MAAKKIEAIQLALSGNSTKERPEERGFGIWTMTYKFPEFGFVLQNTFDQLPPPPL